MTDEPVVQAVIERSGGGRVLREARKGVLSKTRSLTNDGRVAPFPRERFLQFCDALQIQSKDEGLVPFVMKGSQRYILDEICKGMDEGIVTFIILKSRQLGASTFFLALDLFWAFEYRGILGVFATHEEASRDQFRAQIDLFLATLPKKFRVTETTNNRTMLVLKNASLFRYLVAGQRKESNKLGRSGGTNYCHATEVAFWGSAEDLASLLQTFSHLYEHRLYVFESTANGPNHFEEMWDIAVEEPSQRAIFVGWWRDERNEFSERHPNYKFYMPQGVKTPLSKRERDGIKAVKAEYDFDITAGQIAWYRWHLSVNCKGDQSVMEQEQPWTAEDAFVSTGSTFFVNEAITAQNRAAKQALCMPFHTRRVERWQDMQILPTGQIVNANLKIWQQPSPFGKYTLGCDPAFGSSADNDLTAISVWRVWADRAEQVAEFATADISTLQCAWMIAYLGGLYKDVMINIEITGPGTVVMQELDRLKGQAREMVGPDGEDMRNVFARMREFLYRRADSLGGGMVRHWQTTANTKAILMNRYKNYVEIGSAQVKSLACIEEMRRVRIDGGNIEADSGHDDRVIAAALAVYAWAEYRLPELRAKKWTYAYASEVEQKGGEDPMDGLLAKFMKIQKITVKDRIDNDVRIA